MRVLLDTNALLWQIGLAHGGRLGPKTKELLNTTASVYVSAISIVEMQIKTMTGKLDAPADCAAMISDAGNELLAFSPQAADKLRDFPSLAKHDSFDRMLLAQASAERMTFLTADTILLGLNLPFVVDARE